MSIAREVLADLRESIAKAGMIRAGSAQAIYRMRRGADRAANLRALGKPAKNPSRYVRASRYLMSRINRNSSHSWGFGRRPNGSIAKAADALELIAKAAKPQR